MQVEEKKINSPKDAKQLGEAKEEAYKVGFYQGKMIYGDYSGLSVQDAKPKVREALLASGDAFAYSVRGPNHILHMVTYSNRNPMDWSSVDPVTFV
jgi:hypothetical protein